MSHNYVLLNGNMRAAHLRALAASQATPRSFSHWREPLIQWSSVYSLW